MRVVVDTNILVGALARPRPQRLVNDDEAAAIVDNIGARDLVLEDLPEVDLSPDPDDNAILAAAIAGSADLIVSGDKKHVLALGQVAGIPVVTAREALERLALA